MKLLNKSWFPWAFFSSLLIFMCLIQAARLGASVSESKPRIGGVKDLEPVTMTFGEMKWSKVIKFHNKNLTLMRLKKGPDEKTLVFCEDMSGALEGKGPIVIVIYNRVMNYAICTELLDVRTLDLDTFKPLDFSGPAFGIPDVPGPDDQVR